MYGANERREVIMKTKILGLFVLCITLSYTTFANAGCIHRNEAQYQQCMNKTAPVDLEHPNQHASRLPGNLKEFQQVLGGQIPDDVLAKSGGFCVESNGWTPVQNANQTPYACSIWNSPSTGTSWKAVSHNGKPYKFFELGSVVENGQRKSRWILKVDYDTVNGLYAVNGTANKGTSGAPTGVPQMDNTAQDLLKKASDLFRK